VLTATVASTSSSSYGAATTQSLVSTAERSAERPARSAIVGGSGKSPSHRPPAPPTATRSLTSRRSQPPTTKNHELSRGRSTSSTPHTNCLTQHSRSYPVPYRHSFSPRRRIPASLFPFPYTRTPSPERADPSPCTLNPCCLYRDQTARTPNPHTTRLANHTYPNPEHSHRRK
jgi:hypothetical protein